MLYSAFTCHWRPFLKNLVGLGVLQNCSSDLTKLYCLNDGNVSPSMKEGWRWKYVPKLEVGSIWIAGGILSPTIRIAGGKMFPSMRIAGGSLPVLCSEFEGPGPGRRAEQSSKTMLDNRVSASPPPPPPRPAQPSRPHASPALNSHHQTRPTRFPSTNGHFDQKKSSGF